MSKRILVIDDDEAVRKSFTLALEDTDCQVDTADCGEKGLEMLAAQKYGLIYLDLRMPGIDGVEAMREIRKTDQETPIYIVTAFHKEFFEQLRAATDEGIAFDVLSKPLGSDQIVTVTKSVLEGPQSY